jgi:F420-non-reducing hydrogenase large subunit
MTRISIDPITRLEGHGKIEIFLDEQGDVKNCYFQVPELRGFEVFCLGRPAEEMPRLTSRICGVCPEAHLMAAAKALDAVYKVEVPPAGKKLRELLYMAFYVTDHTTHFYALGGPDFVVGPDAPAAERNILGVVAKVGLEIGGQVIATRKRNHEVIKMIGGRPVHPVAAIPGGMSHPITEEQRQQIIEIARQNVEFGQFTIQLFHDVVLANTDYVDLITSDGYTQKTYYMGLVDENNHVNFYDGKVRVVDPEGIHQPRCRTRRTLVLSQIPLPEERGVEGICGRHGQRDLLRDATFPVERGGWHGDSAGAGGIRGHV